MSHELAERMLKKLTTTSSEEVKRTVTIRGKTVEIVEKYIKGMSYSEAVAYLVEMADEFFTDFARSRQGKAGG